MFILAFWAIKNSISVFFRFLAEDFCNYINDVTSNTVGTENGEDTMEIPHGQSSTDKKVRERKRRDFPGIGV